MRLSSVMVFTASLLCFPLIANALPLEQDMDILGSQLVTVQNTGSAQEMHQSLEKMRQAAEDARKDTPYTLQGQAADSDNMKAYRAGIDQLIAQIKVVDALAVNNKLPEAKAAAKKLIEIRNQNHRKFR
ncbi:MULTISPECIES: cytochrome b562 [Tatumella]|uniref:Soluble cytochrome b562 n=2 Tax=Tatumella ptyseos TaxID=82987 RepID=A0A085JK64_9GAMM|nr:MULTISPECIES: cytochrome b562 [Tatumella]KFD20860.1 soluble cytochrome b562 [Tatumella ptyseos ATCC 33301]SQK76850.1 Soluble cytochrome b562 precursor [Tatumella ptyseos]